MGKVYLVGAGPGAADLLTVRAVRLLQQADVVLHDALVTREIVELAPRARCIAVGKRGGRVSTAQRFINRAMVAAAKTHAIVVRLKGGDPLVFGRAHEEMQALRQAGIEFEVVPGITAALAAAAQCKTSLTQRGVARGVSLRTASLVDGVLNTAWPSVDEHNTEFFYMAGSRLGEIARQLLARGWSPRTAALIAANVSLAEASRTLTTLGELAWGEPPAAEGPILLGVGEVFAQAEHTEIDIQTLQSMGALA